MQKKNGSKVNSILIVLEYVSGGELFEFLAFTGSFEEVIARTYLSQMLAGIEYCHSQVTMTDDDCRFLVARALRRYVLND